MTRTERINKLCHAIRLYRGAKNVETGKWHKAPQPHLRERIYSHLVELRMNPVEQLKKIDEFKKLEEFDAWAKTLA